MGCIKCKYAPKTYEEYCAGQRNPGTYCSDAFTEKSHLCGNYDGKDEEIIPEAATNGNLFMTMFPNAEVVEVKYFDGIVSHYQVNLGKINGNQNIVNFKSDWWDAPYKKLYS